MQINDTQLLACFVSPVICNDLVNAGLNPLTTHIWRIYEEQVAMIYTAVYDVDDYYKDGLKHQDSINPPRIILPAYTLKDVENVLPDFLLTKINGEYEISLHKFYNTGTHKARRLPDVLALMLEEVMRKRIVNLTRINDKIFNST